MRQLRLRARGSGTGPSPAQLAVVPPIYSPLAARSAAVVPPIWYDELDLLFNRTISVEDAQRVKSQILAGT